MSQQFVTNALKKVRLDSSVQICSYLFLKILFFRVVLGSRQKREREVPKHPSPYTRTASPPTRSHGFAVTDKPALHTMIAQSQRSPQGPLCVALPVGWGRTGRCVSIITASRRSLAAGESSALRLFIPHPPAPAPGDLPGSASSRRSYGWARRVAGLCRSASFTESRVSKTLPRVLTA